MDIGRILPGIAILSGQIFVCGGEVDSKILANGEVRYRIQMYSLVNLASGVKEISDHLCVTVTHRIPKQICVFMIFLIDSNTWKT